MTAASPTGAAAFLARYEALKDRLPGERAPRATAADAFRRLGLPGATSGRRAEEWKYTALRPLADSPFDAQLTPDAAPPPALPRINGAARLVFVDGRFRADLSDRPAGIAFAPFAAEPDFGRLAQPERDPLVALNTMLAEDGAVIAVPGDTDGGVIHLASVTAAAPGRAGAFHPRHAIRLAPGARLTLVETAQGDGLYLHNPVFEIDVAAGATLEHVRLQDEAPAAFHLATLYVEVAESGRYDAFTLTLGARIARNEIHARLSGPSATVHLRGAQLLSGSQHADATTVVRHDAPQGSSRQVMKNVLTGRARGVFQGRIEVARAAQKTDGYQMSQALLLSPDAEIDTKPELEIFADDVKCSHGSTVGEIDHDQMFYLRSRGVPEAEARAILVRAFLVEALEGVANEAARATLEAAVARWWERQTA